MKKITDGNGWPLIRFIAPAFSELNVFTRQAKSTTTLGLIMVATAAHKIWGWRVEVIDENNYRGPRDNRGLPDHATLQEENPATAVGFYCGLSCTMERVWELAEFYQGQEVFTIAGSWHAHYCLEEMHNKNIKVIVHGDGEIAIQQILCALKEGKPLGDIPGISFLENGEVKRNPPEMLEIPDLNDLPYPDFNLLKYAKIRIFPIGRIRGCRMNCEFCGVRGKPRWATSQYLFNVVNWLVETRGARDFFVVDDRSEEDRAGTDEFFRMVAEKYGKRLSFTVQVRLDAAKNTESLAIMKRAGVRTACIGYESPIDAELIAMRKGYLSSHMLEWTKILRRYFRIHAMFIFRYPPKEGEISISVKEIIQYLKEFIRKARPDTLHILHPVPLVGTDLRKRLEKEGRIFPLDLVPWRQHDGTVICFRPDKDNMSLREFQEVPVKIMGRFYHWSTSIRIFFRTITLPVDSLIRGWEKSHHDWYRDYVRYGAHRFLQRWRKRQKDTNNFIERLEQYQLKQNSR